MSASLVTERMDEWMGKNIIPAVSLARQKHKMTILYLNCCQSIMANLSVNVTQSLIANMNDII